MSNRSVHACAEGLWHLHYWDPANPAATSVRVPFRCRSWRHGGPCREWKGAQDFMRVKQAMESRDHWSYIVLTFKQRVVRELTQALEGGHFWAALRKRLDRAFGKYKYIQTWEKHKIRGYHVNVAISSERIYDVVHDQEHPNEWTWLADNAEECGFGRICWAENLRNGKGDLAKYLTKLSRELTGSGPKHQIPINAPRHFRRLRASVGLLPPPFKGKYTGKLVQCPVESFERKRPGKALELGGFVSSSASTLERPSRAEVYTS